MLVPMEVSQEGDVRVEPTLETAWGLIKWSSRLGGERFLLVEYGFYVSAASCEFKEKGRGGHILKGLSSLELRFCRHGRS